MPRRLRVYAVPRKQEGAYTASVARSDDVPLLAELGRQMQEAGQRFADAARPALADAIEHRVERLVSERASWFNALDEGTRTALRRAVADTIQSAARSTATRLKDPDLWRSPTVLVDQPLEDRFDHPNDRAWIAMLNAADALDGVLVEFGLHPSPIPDAGGGHFGLQPQAGDELDPRGVLGRLWRQYARIYVRYREVERSLPEQQRARERAEALRRWRGEPERA